MDAHGTYDTQFLTTLRRGMAVLEYVAAAPSGCRASAVAEDLGLSRGACYHVIRTLVEDGYLARQPGSRIVIGHKLGELLNGYQTQLEPDPRLVDLLYGLRDTVSSSVYISGWVQHTVAIRYHLEGEGAVRVRNTPIGYSANPHARAAARAILAFLPANEAFRHIPKQMAAITAKTVTDPDELKLIFRTIRATGLSHEEEEFAPGVGCMACPVFDANGYPMGAFGLSAPLAQYTTSFDDFSTALLATAASGSRALGWKGKYPARQLTQAGQTPRVMPGTG